MDEAINYDLADPATIAAHLARGEVDPRVHDIFIVALEETKAKAEAKFKRIGRLEDRAAEIAAEIERERLALDALTGTYEEQVKAIEAYQAGDEIADCLLPKC